MYICSAGCRPSLRPCFSCLQLSWGHHFSAGCLRAELLQGAWLLAGSALVVLAGLGWINYIWVIRPYRRMEKTMRLFLDGYITELSELQGAGMTPAEAMLVERLGEMLDSGKLLKLNKRQAQNLGLQGDIAVDEGNYKEAVKFFEKAVEAADNNATAPIFLMKAGRAYKALGDTAKAKECFERIATAYPSSFEARDIEKYINSL